MEESVFKTLSSKLEREELYYNCKLPSKRLHTIFRMKTKKLDASIFKINNQQCNNSMMNISQPFKVNLKFPGISVVKEVKFQI